MVYCSGGGGGGCGCGRGRLQLDGCRQVAEVVCSLMAVDRLWRSSAA